MLSSEKMKQIESTLKQADSYIGKLEALKSAISESLEKLKSAPQPSLPSVVVTNSVPVREVQQVGPQSVAGCFMLSLAALSPSSWRYSRPTQEEQVKLLSMMKKRGQLRPIHVSGTYGEGRWTIVDGHRIYECLKEIGSPTAWCVTHEGLTDEDARLLALELNEARGEIDHIRLASLFCGLVEKLGAAEVAAHVGLTQDQVQSYAALINFDWKEYASSEAEKCQEEMW